MATDQQSKSGSVLTEDVTPSPRSSRQRLRRGSSNLIYALISLGLMVGIWKAIQVGFHMAPYLLPAPETVASVAVSEHNLLLEHMFVTLREVVYGFGLAVLVGVPLAVVMATWKPLELLLYPALVASQGVPKSALAPILVIWLGFGIMPKVVMAVLIAFFPIVVSTFVGLKGIQPEMVDLGRTIGLSRLAMLRKIMFPNALPSVFGGLKVAITLAVVGAVVGEFVAAEAGLGYLLIVTTAQVRTDLMFAALTYVAVMGIVLFLAVDLLERLAIPWYAERQLQVAA
jgi:NitT/TauT family transport system permease protein